MSLRILRILRDKLFSCRHPMVGIVDPMNNSKELEILGIQELLETSGNAHASIFYVHGMAGFTYDQFAKFNHSLSGKLNLEEVHKDTKNVSWSDSDGKTHRSELRVWRYTRGKSIVDVYGADWGLINKKNQEWVGEMDGGFDLFRPRRAHLNLFLKKMFMTESFVNVAMWLNLHKTEIKSFIRACIVSVEERSKQTQKECSDLEQLTVLVASSQGSDIILHTLVEMASCGSKETEETARKFIHDVDLVHFWANQIGFFQMANGESFATDKSKGSKYVLEEFVNLHNDTKYKRKGRTRSKVWMVSVSDPEDILSFPVPRDLMKRMQGELVDVYLSNANVYRLPFKWSFANPLKAHTGHVENPDVLKLLIDGANHDDFKDVIPIDT